MATQTSRATNTGSRTLAMAGWLLKRYLASEFFNLGSTLTIECARWHWVEVAGLGGAQEIGGQDAFRGTN